MNIYLIVEFTGTGAYDSYQEKVLCAFVDHAEAEAHARTLREVVNDNNNRWHAAHEPYREWLKDHPRPDDSFPASDKARAWLHERMRISRSCRPRFNKMDEEYSVETTELKGDINIPT